MGERRLGAETGVLLVRDQGEDHAADVVAGDLFGGHDQSGDSAFHVGGAAPVPAVAVDTWLEWRRHLVDPDGVEVPVEQDRRARCAGLPSPRWQSRQPHRAPVQD
jgi:hypothetical protein